MFAKDKGIAENGLQRQGFDQLYIFRPGYIYPVTPRVEPNMSYRIMRWLYPIFNYLYPKGAVESTVLANTMFFVGLKGANKSILENKDIKEF